jgi:spore coat protein U-like protein
MSIKFNQRNLKLAIAAGMLVGSAGLTVPAYAATDTSSMNVTTNIGMNCTISTTDIAFGEYKPTTDHASTALTANGAVSTTCTVGSTGKIIIGQGEHPGSGSSDAVPVRRMATAGDASFLSYEVFSDEGRSTAWTSEVASGVAYTASGSAQNMPVYGRVAAGQTGATQGSYADVLVVTVNY